jgi:hypothetical protein
MAMAVSKPRLVASGLAVAGLGLGSLWGSHWGKTFFGASTPGAHTVVAQPDRTQLAADKGATPPESKPAAKVDAGRNVVVEAPHTSVKVGKDTGKVAVSAPHTNVKVDPDKGRVQVRAPYVNLDIRW